MGLVMLQVLDLVLIVSVFSCSLVIQGSAEHSLTPSLSAVPPVGEGTPGYVSNISIAPAPVSQPNGTDLQPPSVTPPFISAPVPQPTNGLLPPSIWPAPSSPLNHFGPPPESIQDSVPSVPPVASHSEPPPLTVQAPAPIRSPTSSSPPTEQTHPTMPGPMPPNSHQTRAPTSNAPLFATPPGSSVPSPRGMRESPPPSHSALPENPPPSHSNLPENSPPSHSALPEEPPSLPPDVSTHPTLPGNSPPIRPIVNEPLSSPPEQNFSPILAPPPSISKKTAPMPVAAPANKTAHQYAPLL
ncbi:hypothetical protein CDL12_02134 [Handroanthus impetiginosus]|uniref:Non-specific serine/threonine protein kinase n=1 Tax=Handroanthus impetiginosus TaxID=429701 RepID=A0A2G9I5T1_9LAMI|nr:hypothetical protein CDL12_02134 [Handroanthus impetiginosus]